MQVPVTNNGYGVATVEVDGAVNVVLTNLVPQHGFDPVTHAVVSTNNAQVSANFNVGATVAQDTRAVTLSRNGARQVKPIAGLNGLVYGEWVDPNGAAHGDTTFSYWTFGHAGLSTIVSDQINWQTLSPAFKGTWPIWPATWNYQNNMNWWWYIGDPYDPLYTSDIDNTDGETALARTQNAPAVAWSWSPSMTSNWELAGNWSAPDGNGVNWSSNGIGDPGLTTPHAPVTKPITYNVSESVSQHFPWQNNLSVLDGTQASATYYLTFHDPIEGWHTNGPAYEIDPTLYPNAVADGQPTSFPAGPTIPVAIPRSLDYVDYGPGVRLAGGLLTTGAATYPLIVDAAGASLGPWGIGMVGLATGLGFTAGLYDPREPKWPLSLPTDEPSFYSDIATEEKVHAGIAVASPRTDPNFVLLPTTHRFADLVRAHALAQMTQPQQDAYWVGTGKGGKFWISTTGVAHNVIQPYAAYQFDQAGLIVDAQNNPVFAKANVQRTGSSYEAIRTWTWKDDPLP